MTATILHKRLLTLGLAALSFGAGIVSAASNYSENWDSSGDAAGWTGNTISSFVAQADGVGNPLGALATYRQGLNNFDIGAMTELPAATGSYSGTPWTVSFDVRYVSGSFTDGWLRFRYQDSTFNGWRYDFADAFPDEWTTYSVTFDPSWSDAEATANGWTQESGPVVDWSTTLGDVHTTELRLATEGQASAYIDNFSVQAVPEPSTYALFAAGLLAVSFIARRRVGSGVALLR